MEKTVEKKRKIKALVAGVKRINDDPKSLIETTYDNYKDDLSIKGNAVKKNINDFTSKLKGRTKNKKDIFSDILETMDGLLGADKEDSVNTEAEPLIQSKTLRYAKEAAQKTIRSSRQFVTNEVKKGYFSGQGSCNPNSVTLTSGYTISPKHFDFINMLKVDPTSISGKVMYETQPDPLIGVQFNRKLYEKFDSPSIETIDKKDGTGLFDIGWDSPTQKYVVTVGAGVNIADFIDDYYNTIEQPDIEDVMKNAMLMSLQGDGTEPSSFNVGMDYLNRLLTKLFSVCGSPSTNNSPFLNNTTEQISEDEIDIQDYFNFDDIEGIDLDDEDARKRRVLKFTDCDNFEIPTNSNHMEDFTYLLDTKNLDENINNTLKKVAIDAYEQSDNSIYLEGFQLSIMKNYILQIPRAMISTVLSPKIMFPIALTYDMLYSEVMTVKELMKKMSGMFFNIIKTLFWDFIKNFWKLIKRDLLKFLKQTAKTILENQVKKVKKIVLGLINLLIKVLQSGINSCDDIFTVILRVIQAALNVPIKIPIPGLLLVLAERLPGFSSDRAYMNALERLEASGINVGPIYGTENKLPSFVKSVIEGYSDEMNSNSYVKIALKQAIIPAGPGGAVLSPLITGAGKLF